MRLETLPHRKRNLIDGVISVATVVLCATALWEAIDRSSIPFQTSAGTQYIIRELLFWASAHGVASVFVLLKCTEFQKLRSEHQKTGYSIRPTYVAVFLLVAVLSFCLLKVGAVNNVLAPWCYLGLSFLVSYPNLRHMSRQTLGLSLIYNHRISNQTEQNKLRQQEGLVFDVLQVILFPMVLCFYGWLYFHVVAAKTALNMLVAGCFLICSFHVVNIFRTSKDVEKKLFSIRILLYPLAFVSQIGFSGLIATHGVEHIRCLYRILETSELKAEPKQASAKKQFIAFILISPLAYAALVWRIVALAPSSGIITPNVIHMSLAIPFAIYNGLNVSHYILDRYMFKMRDPKTRELIGPLLKAQSY